MNFFKNFWTGLKIALAVASVVNGRKIGSTKINIKEIPDVIDLVNDVEVIVEAAHAAQKAAEAEQRGEE